MCRKLVPDIQNLENQYSAILIIKTYVTSTWVRVSGANMCLSFGSFKYQYCYTAPTAMYKRAQVKQTDKINRKETTASDAQENRLACLPLAQCLMHLTAHTVRQRKAMDEEAGQRA